MDFIADTRIAITGTGICSAIGQTCEKVVENLIAGRSGIAPFEGDGKEKMVSRYAARVRDFDIDDHFPKQAKQWWDLATQMAAKAAADAVEKSQILNTNLSRQHIGLAIGVSGAGQFSPNRSAKLDSVLSTEIAELLYRRNTPHFQLYQIARWLRLNGPMVCVSSASSGSGIAIANAARWLLAHRADAVVAGGGEAIQLLNFLGFDTLGLLSPNPCSPFSRCEGMTMGEGAGFVVMERLDDAVRRNATILGVLMGVGISSDAFDPILYDPTGDGIRRAMQAAIADAGLAPRDIGWIRSSGAGNRDQDTSEVMAIRSLFADQPPLVSSTEAHHGHCNGAGPAMGFVAALEVQRAGWIPPTLNFGETNHTGIDFVANVAREHRAQYFLSNTAAFGGSNVVLIGSSELGKPNERKCDEVVVTGIGVVSGFGSGKSDFAKSIGAEQSFIGPIDRKNVEIEGVSQAGLVRNFNFRREFPSVPSRGLDLLTQYATVAFSKALGEAESCGTKFNSDRLGIATGLSYTSGSALEKLMAEIQGPWATPTIGRTLLNKGRFIVTSRLANWFNCKAYNATHSGGIGVGQVALNQAAEQLHQSPELDAIVVVAADEVSRIRLQIAQRMGWLTSGDSAMQPNSDKSQGMILGEGAVALVLERRSSAANRGAKALAVLDSTACSLDDLPLECEYSTRYERGFQMRADSPCLENAIRDCLKRGSLKLESMDLVLGSACGIPFVDQRDRSIVERVFGCNIMHGTGAGITGFNLSSGGLFNLALGIAAFNHPEALQLLRSCCRTTGPIERNTESCVVLSSSEDGHNVVTSIKKVAT